MDNRLKEIIDNYDSLKIGIDEPFRFNCTQCGKCCINRDDILLNPKDLYNLGKELKMTPEDVVMTYCETYIGDSSRFPIVRLRPRGSIKRCPLLKDRKCSVHKAKPTVCAMFPIGRCLKMDEKHPVAVKDLQIEYIFSSPGCGNDSETHTVREWLESFQIPLKDEFFFLWHQTIFDVTPVIHNVEKVWSETTLDRIWTFLYGMLYLNYDIEKEFLPQYIDNAKAVEDLFKHM